ncbi:MAG TPA: hypothetical protein VEL07_06990 [Planctomycetota bacterium]|nr:hypothetical protein [Planctomycetota bacterium]
MNIGDVLGWTLLVALGWLGLVGWWLVAQGLGPAAMLRARAAYRRPVATTLVGVLWALPAVALAVALALVSRSLALAVAPLLALAALGVIGSAGLAHAVGDSIGEGEPAQRLRRGAMALASACLTPFVGWFVLLPWLLLSGVGAAFAVWRDRTRPPGPASSGENP